MCHIYQQSPPSWCAWPVENGHKIKENVSIIFMHILLPIYRFTAAETSAIELPIILSNPATVKVSLDSIIILQTYTKKAREVYCCTLIEHYVDITTFYILSK